MKNIYAYIRVSTVKQGDGVSLEVQKKDIERFAQQKNLNIVEWFEERKSASKGLRPQFNRMIENLYNQEADGFVAHKIDRMMRNRHDWAIINELIDEGCEVLSADGTTLDDVNGRFMGDIQAAVATRYSHNLALEAKKGLYGRLAQGILPFPAPIGYLDQGKAKLKTIDPVKAPLIVQLFELYALKGYSVLMLVDEIYNRGLRNNRNNKLCKNGIIRVLRNPYYAGIIEVKGQQFESTHTPLIPMNLYKKTQEILDGKANAKIQKHDFLFRKMIKCQHCGRTLIGELQKGEVYYRCHTKECPNKSLTESCVKSYIKRMFQAITITDSEILDIEQILSTNTLTWREKQKEGLQIIQMQKGSLRSRQERITSLLINETIDDETYHAEKKKILTESKLLEEKEEAASQENSSLIETIAKKLELANNPYYIYELLNTEDKREFLKSITSNLLLDGKKLVITMLFPYLELANRNFFSFGAPSQDRLRETESCLVLGDKIYTEIPKPLDKKGCERFINYLIENQINH